MGNPIPPRPSSGAELAAGSAAQRVLLSPRGRLVWVFAALAAIRRSRRWESLAVAAVIVVTLTVFATMAAPDIVAAFGWQSATLEIDRVPAILGSSPAATYRRRSRKARDVSDAVVSCRVVCEERVVYERKGRTPGPTSRTCSHRPSPLRVQVPPMGWKRRFSSRYQRGLERRPSTWAGTRFGGT